MLKLDAALDAGGVPSPRNLYYVDGPDYGTTTCPLTSAWGVTPFTILIKDDNGMGRYRVDLIVRHGLAMIGLLNCDCMEYMATVPDRYFDLAIVDPLWDWPRWTENNKNGRPGHGEKRRTNLGWDNSTPNKTYFDG